MSQENELKELVGAFAEGFMERGSGKMIYSRIPPHLARRLADYVDQMKELIKDNGKEG